MVPFDGTRGGDVGAVELDLQTASASAAGDGPLCGGTAYACKLVNLFSSSWPSILSMCGGSDTPVLAASFNSGASARRTSLLMNFQAVVQRQLVARAGAAGRLRAGLPDRRRRGGTSCRRFAVVAPPLPWALAASAPGGAAAAGACLPRFPAVAAASGADAA